MNKKYLIQDLNSIFTISEGRLVDLGITELSAALFVEHGFDNFSGMDGIVNLEKPRICCWCDESTEAPTTLTLTAVPVPQTIIAKDISLLDTTITGIDNVLFDCTGSPLVAISFDGGNYEKFIAGTGWTEADLLDGMTPEVFTGITTEEWASKIEGVEKMTIRTVLDTNDDTLSGFTFNFING